MNRALGLLALLMLFSQFACADTGPIPSMTFYLDYETSKPVTLMTSGNSQIECSDKDCIDGKPLAQMGPYGFSCDRNNQCFSRGDGISIEYAYPGNYHKLVLNFSDAVRESNVFIAESDKYHVVFNVRVTDTGLIVSEIKPPISEQSSFPLALCITIILELVVAVLFLLATNSGKGFDRILASVMVVNLVSLPFVWFVFPPLFPGIAAIVLAELFALVFEAGAIFFANKQFITLKRAFILSFLMNAVSLFIGGFVYVFLSPMFVSA